MARDIYVPIDETALLAGLRRRALVADSLVSNVLTRHSPTIAVGGDGLVSNLLGCGAGAVAEVGDALVPNLLRRCRLTVAEIRDALVTNLLRSSRLTIAVGGDALIANLLRRRAVSSRIRAYTLRPDVLTSRLGLRNGRSQHERCSKTPFRCCHFYLQGQAHMTVVWALGAVDLPQRPGRDFVLSFGKFVSFFKCLRFTGITVFRTTWLPRDLAQPHPASGQHPNLHCLLPSQHRRHKSRHLTQGSQIYFGDVGQFYIGGDT